MLGADAWFRLRNCRLEARKANGNALQTRLEAGKGWAALMLLGGAGFLLAAGDGNLLDGVEAGHRRLAHQHQASQMTVEERWPLVR